MIRSTLVTIGMVVQCKKGRLFRCVALLRSQLPAARKWSTSMKEAIRKHKKMEGKFCIRDFLDRTIINAQVSPPTVACVTLSKIARVSSDLPRSRPKSPMTEQTPIAHVSTAHTVSLILSVYIASRTSKLSNRFSTKHRREILETARHVASAAARSVYSMRVYYLHRLIAYIVGSS